MCDHEVGMQAKAATINAYCSVNGCLNRSVLHGYCVQHSNELKTVVGELKPKEKAPDFPIKMTEKVSQRSTDGFMSAKYPKYYKPVGNLKEVDVYAVCKLFPVADDTGCINHARKKLLVPGTRTGGKSFRDDIKEARDTLTRWLELNPE